MLNLMFGSLTGKQVMQRSMMVQRVDTNRSLQSLTEHLPYEGWKAGGGGEGRHGEWGRGEGGVTLVCQQQDQERRQRLQTGSSA